MCQEAGQRASFSTIVFIMFSRNLVTPGESSARLVEGARTSRAGPGRRLLATRINADRQKAGGGRRGYRFRVRLGLRRQTGRGQVVERASPLHRTCKHMPSRAASEPGQARPEPARPRPPCAVPVSSETVTREAGRSLAAIVSRRGDNVRTESWNASGHLFTGSVGVCCVGNGAKGMAGWLAGQGGRPARNTARH